MKRLKKHSISIILMSSSIALLVAFQYFWLQKVYDEQRTWLQKEASNLFQWAIADLQDSIIQSKIMGKDSCDLTALMQFHKRIPLHSEHSPTVVFRNDSGNTQVFQREPFDIPMEPGYKISSNVKVMLTASDSLQYWQGYGERRQSGTTSMLPISPDSIRSIQINKTLSQLILKVQQIDGNKDFVLRIDNDSIPITLIQNAFAKRLHLAGIPISFNLFKVKFPEFSPSPEKLIVGPVPAGMPPHNLFAAELLAYRGYLFQKIILQLLFSIFLVGITALAFGMVHRSLRQQQRLAQLKNDFISNVTHELKTPIATVSVAIEALNNFNALQNPQLTREYLDISKNELNRLNILVDKVLKMAIFEQGEPDLRPERFDFRAMVQQIMDSMRLQFEKCDAKVLFDAQGEDFTIEGDVMHLTSVVYNLIDNALKYSKKEPEITVQLEQNNGQLDLSIQDNGIGIAPEHQAKIFEKFYRVSSGDVHNTKGHGLGLSYVANVVRKHGGRIDLQSEFGSGSRFTVHLPRYDA